MIGKFRFATLLLIFSSLVMAQSTRITYQCTIDAPEPIKTTLESFDFCPAEMLMSPNATLTKMRKSSILKIFEKGKLTQSFTLFPVNKEFQQNQIREVVTKHLDAAEKHAQQQQGHLMVENSSIEDLPEEAIADLTTTGLLWKFELRMNPAFGLPGSAPQSAAEALKKLGPVRTTLSYRSSEALLLKQQNSQLGTIDPRGVGAGFLPVEPSALNFLSLFQLPTDSLDRLNRHFDKHPLAIAVEVDLPGFSATSPASQAPKSHLRIQWRATSVSTSPIPESEFQIPSDFRKITK